MVRPFTKDETVTPLNCATTLGAKFDLVQMSACSSFYSFLLARFPFLNGQSEGQMRLGQASLVHAQHLEGVVAHFSKDGFATS